MLDFRRKGLVDLLAHLESVCERLDPTVDLSEARQRLSEQDQVNTSLDQSIDPLSLDLKDSRGFLPLLLKSSFFFLTSKFIFLPFELEDLLSLLPLEAKNPLSLGILPGLVAI